MGRTRVGVADGSDILSEDRSAYFDAGAIKQVGIDDAFWSPKRTVWQEVTIRDCFRKFESDRGGAINNFDKVAGGNVGGHAGDPWMD